MKKAALGLAAVLLLLFAAWHVAVPDSVIESLIQGSVSSGRFSLRCSGVSKGLFPGFTCRKLSLASADEELLIVEDCCFRLMPSSLFLFKPALSFEGKIGKGTISGETALMDGSVRMHIEQAPTDGFPVLKLSGLEGSGNVSGDLSFKGEGSIKLKITDARFRNASFGLISIPLESFRTLMASAVYDGTSVKIESFTLEGPEVYSRIKGDVRGGNVDLVMEIMPGASYEAGNPAMRLIESYRVSPGFYSIPLKGDIESLLPKKPGR